MDPLHPSRSLQSAAHSLPLLPYCEHYAGSEKLITKSFLLSEELGPVFDLTCDCEDGAAVGAEQTQLEMIADVLTSARRPEQLRIGVRVHPVSSEHFAREVEFLCSTLGAQLAYLTVPKLANRVEAETAVQSIRAACSRNNLKHSIPVHLLIETIEAVADVHVIAALSGVEVLDFGLLDFISEHQGAIPASAMRSPGQFEHQLLIRAKTEIVSAALRHGKIPAHNISLDLHNPRQVTTDAHIARNRFGFLRMWSIHLSQIPAIVEGMRPPKEDLQRMGKILLNAYRAGWSPISYEGELHDRASYRYFWDSLQRAKLSQSEIDEEVIEVFFSS